LSVSTDASGVPDGSSTYIVLQQWESGSGPHTGGGVDRFNELFVDPNADDFNNRACNTVGTDTGIADSCLGPAPFDSNVSEASNSIAGVWTVSGGGGQTATTTSVVSSLNPSTSGQSVTFTATVTGSSPTGTVQFKDGGSDLGSAVTLSGSSAELTTSSLAVATHSISAVYSGDANNLASTSNTVNQVVTASVVPPPSVTAVPTLSQWVLLAMALIVAVWAIATLRRAK
jgi:hypothetical protein